MRMKENLEPREKYKTIKKELEHAKMEKKLFQSMLESLRRSTKRRDARRLRNRRLALKTLF